MRFVGFIVGFAIAAGLEFLLLSTMGAIPRGPGWLVLPVVAGIALSRAAPDLMKRATDGSAEQAFFQLSPATRTAAIGTALWLIAVPAYVYLFEPYGPYMASYDYTHMLKAMLFPTALIVVGSLAYKRFVVGPDKEAPAVPKPKNLAARNDEIADLESDNPRWYYSTNGQQIGPVYLQRLNELIAAGTVGPEDTVFGPGSITWRKIKDTKLGRGGEP